MKVDRNAVRDYVIIVCLTLATIVYLSRGSEAKSPEPFTVQEIHDIKKDLDWVSSYFKKYNGVTNDASKSTDAAKTEANKR